MAEYRKKRATRFPPSQIHVTAELAGWSLRRPKLPPGCPVFRPVNSSLNPRTGRISRYARSSYGSARRTPSPSICHAVGDAGARRWLQGKRHLRSGKSTNALTWAADKLTSIQDVPATEIETLIQKKLDGPRLPKIDDDQWRTT